MMILLLCVVFLFIIPYIIYIYLKGSDSEATRDFDKIPGPEGLPLVGNLQDYFKSNEEIWRLARARALQFHPIYKLKIFNKRIVHLFDPKDVEVILKDSRHMSKGPLYDPFKSWIGKGLLVAEGETWRKQRKLLTKCFHFGALTKYMQSFNDEAENLSKSLIGCNAKPSAELDHQINKHTMKVALGILLGNHCVLTNESIEEYLKSLRTLTRITGMKIFMPLMNFLYRFTKAKKEEENALRIFNGYSSQIIRNGLVEDLNIGDQERFLNVIMTKYDSNILRQDELNNFIFGGQDTTATSITFILYILANKPRFQEELYEEIMEVSRNETPTQGEINQMNFLDRFVKECFRMYPPASFVGRCSSEDVSLPSGYKIPAGTLIFVDIFDIHRNPNVYHEPDKFDPDRFLPENISKRHPYSFIPFSAGPRNCIAQKFAILEIKTTICGILKKFRLDPLGSLEDIILVPDLLLKTKFPMKVIFRSRSE